MRWRLLGFVLAAILVGAVVFSRWPSSAPPALPLSEPAAPVALAPAPAPRPEGAPAPKPVEAAAAPSPTPPRPTSPLDAGAFVQDPVPDEGYAESLGIRVEPEPEDAGVLHALTRDGIKGAIQAELPEIKECYEAWLAQSPQLSGKLKVQFTIVEVPGKARGKVIDVDTPDAGMGHLAFEGCVKNVFAGMRFEKPERGEMKVTYPLAFENTPAP